MLGARHLTLSPSKIVCNDIKIICLGFNAGNTTVLWVTVKELSPKGEHSSCISLHSVLYKGSVVYER